MSDSKVKIFTIAEVPQDLMQSWLQHLRDFDTQYPGCHFRVAANAPDATMADMIQALQIEPGFDDIVTIHRTKT